MFHVEHAQWQQAIGMGVEEWFGKLLQHRMLRLQNLVVVKKLEDKLLRTFPMWRGNCQN